MERPEFVNEEIYHIYNRGVEKRHIFLTNENRLRFINGLYIFNDSNPTFNTERLLVKNKFGATLKNMRDKLVEIIAFILMPNHYHLLLRQIKEGGITSFMRKNGTGYTKYFNIENNRVGPLFQGKFKAVHVTKDSQLQHLPHYIHLNTLDMHFPGWRDGDLKNYKKASNVLEKYRWSSYLDYIGKENFSHIIEKNVVKEFFGDPKQYKKDMTEWLKSLCSKSDFEQFDFE